MRIWPVVLDWQPSYMGGQPGSASLLLAPTGKGALLCDFHARLPLAREATLTVAPRFVPAAGYLAALQARCSLVQRVAGPGDLGDAAAAFDPADWLLLSDPLCFPAEPIDAGPVLAGLVNNRSVVHMVAMTSHPDGISDCVQFDSRGVVRRIPRSYDVRTWSSLAGVACTLIPVATFLRFSHYLDDCSSLTDFRSRLASAGVPGQDVAFGGEAMHLNVEGELLRMSHRGVLTVPGAEQAPHGTSRIHAGARISGPVVIQEEVVIEPGAAVIGPAVLGRGSRIGANAVVAQCLVGEGVEVPPNATIRHRAMFRSAHEAPPALAQHRAEQVWTPLTELPADTPAAVLRYTTVKMLLDRGLALTGLVLLSPLLALIAVLIKLDSRGPVLYGDLRETIGGRLFYCWKFRTMRQGAATEQWDLSQKNQMDGPQFKINGDPRVTLLGRWLRKISLDELPQLLNVLTGDMSLVGPRPSPFRENQICVPWRQARLSVRAGITGLWQVSRDDRRKGDFHQWIQYDLLYVQHLSWHVDAKILLATALTLGGAGRVPPEWILPKRRHPRRDEAPATAPARVGAPV